MSSPVFYQKNLMVKVSFGASAEKETGRTDLVVPGSLPGGGQRLVDQGLVVIRPPGADSRLSDDISL